MPFRGHENDSKHHANVDEQSSKSVGLFQNLSNFQVSRPDNVLSTSAKNARYTSASIQNQLIDSAGKVISKKLLKEINESGICDLSR